MFCRNLCVFTIIGFTMTISDTLWWAQDGAPAHNALIVREWIRKFFLNRVVALHHDVKWSPRSPDLTLCDFFWGICQKWNLYFSTRECSCITTKNKRVIGHKEGPCPHKASFQLHDSSGTSMYREWLPAFRTFGWKLILICVINLLLIELSYHFNINDSFPFTVSFLSTVPINPKT